MSTVLASPVPKLDEVRSILLSKTTWQLPQDLKEKSEGAKVVSLEELKKLPMSQCVEIFSPVHRVALLSAAAHLAVPAPKVAQTLITIFNELPGPAYNTTPEFKNSPYDFTPGLPLSDEDFTNFLKAIYPDAEKEVLELFEEPYVSAAQVLLLVSTIELVSDYALIAAVLDAEFKGAALLSSEEFSRELAPQFVSIVAQRIFDIALNSKNLRKKGSKILSSLPKLFAPIFAAVAQLRTAVVKPQHFFDKFTLFSYTSNIVYSTVEICKYLGKPADNVTVENASQLLATAAFSMISGLAPKVQESIEKKRITVGTISKEIAVAVAENGPAALTMMNFYAPPAGKKVLPKEPVGCIDLLPKQMKVRQEVIQLVTSIFKRHGGVAIDTPVFELRSVLTEKYGEESKLIYNLEDQGGELLSLRYDLTVPFARFVATHGITKIKRYHIAKVYRRDKPAIERGRFREFYQCDFDVAGTSGLMISDAEVISIVSELLTAIGKLCRLDNFNYSIRVSHRQLLSAMTKVAGVPDEKFKTICSSVDKLDKLPWSDVSRELVDVKGLSQAAADKLGEFVSIQGNPREVLAALRQKQDFVAVAGKVLDEMEVLFNYLEATGCLGNINFDLSLARGLDYYTGVIYEAGTTSGDVGSIAGGGRYDGLIGMFSGRQVPAVGVSLGIERIFALIERLKANEEVKESDTEVYIAGIFSDYTKKRFELASKFWELGVPTEFFPKEKPDIKQQLLAAEQLGAKVFVLLAPDELEKGQIKIREMTPKGVERQPIERVVPEADVVQETIKLLNELKNAN
ncbi:histidyl-tRNA synthetase family protein [Trichomonas vaginalis G3]|uniref:histidine--tRNA ligase n=1 Tax=Trichomonas vaginalis (strain ATCC PRA-98 / G3) TaxID=412133 RepID=A2EJM3_TRIV3|nr:histidyl-tRNA synthetase family [Trichomonas vaginalis G3]EAY07097.1 histidyl-tRNA synthetase family protein [Trichomonas vaginalis G3]KAI5522447.1 histidyl-tRNA synthetase family [Trichomonas vaginalis G3]|eukprot:XP_001319320.1 histidyl-tRNA synthetase family protein [Trichomonas vaginalis G3]